MWWLACAMWFACVCACGGSYGRGSESQQAAPANESPLRSDQVVLPEASAPEATVMTRELSREIGPVYYHFGFLRAPGDIDGDGACDLAVFASTGERPRGVEIRSSRTGEVIRSHPGGAGYSRHADVAYAGDVDGDGFDDYVLALTNQSPPGQHLLQCISGKTGEALATRRIRNGSETVRLCGATVTPGAGASPVAYFSGSTYLILESADLSTRTTIPMPIRGRCDGVFADWGCDGSLDLIVLESLPGKLRAGLSIYSATDGELKGSIGRQRLLEGPRATRGERGRSRGGWTAAEEWGFALALSGNRLVLNGPKSGELVELDICTRRVEAEYEIFDGLGYLGGLLSIDDMDDDQVNDLYVWGDDYVLGMPVGACSMISGASGKRITPPELDRGDMYGVALARADGVSESGLLIFDGEDATLEFRSSATEERVWKSESLGSNWSRARVAEVGDVDGDSQLDWLVSGLSAGTPGYHLTGSSPKRPRRATWSNALKLGGASIVSGATGAVLGRAPGFGSHSMSAEKKGAVREFALCLNSGPGNARLALWNPAGELEPFDVSVGDGVIAIEPLVLTSKGEATVCLFAVDEDRMKTDCISISLETLEECGRRTIQGVVTAALPNAAGTGWIATRISKANPWFCSSELVSMDSADVHVSPRVLKSWGTDWGPATALARSNSGDVLAVGFPELRHVWKGGLEAMGATTSGGGIVTVYHHHQGRVAVLEFGREAVGQQRELDAPNATRGFGESLTFLRQWSAESGEILAVGACSPIVEDTLGEVLLFSLEDEFPFLMRIIDSD